MAAYALHCAPEDPEEASNRAKKFFHILQMIFKSLTAVDNTALNHTKRRSTKDDAARGSSADRLKDESKESAVDDNASLNRHKRGRRSTKNDAKSKGSKR